MLSLLAFRFQSPGPIVFDFGSVTVRWYGLLIASAVIIGVLLSQYLAKRRGVDPEIIGDLSVWLILAAIPGARLYYVAFEWENYAQRPEAIIAIWQGGIAIHGAIIGGAIALLIFCRLNQTSFWQLADLITPSLILGQGIGRWGNFFNSEAFGTPTDLPWKLYIPPANRPPQYLDEAFFHPTFLYESLWDFGVFLLLIYLFFWGLRHPQRYRVGTLVFVYMAAYSSGRIWIEDLRTDSLMLGSIQVAQLISLVAIIIGIAGLIWLYQWKRNLPDIVSQPKIMNNE
jgi:phosphatidylglycerol:prolipoprotein diacylglycerol transferase